MIGIKRGTQAAALAAILISTVSVSAMAADISISPKERASLEMRVMQSELMVAALSCAAADDYNAFVTRYRSQLVAHGKTLQGLFKRVHGGNAFKQINTFVTRVANEASLKMVRDSGRFCADADRTFEILLHGGTDSLARTRDRYRCTPIHGFADCTVEAASTQVLADDETAR